MGGSFNLSLVQSAILISLGLQHKSVEDMEKELTLPPNQLLAMFNKVIKKMINLLEELSVSQMNKILFSDANNGGFKLDKKMDPLKQSLEDELNEASRKVKSDEMQHKKELLSNFDLKQ